MSSIARLSTLKTSQLKYAAFLMGLPSSGTKPVLQSEIQRQLQKPASYDGHGRIVSVDMGIKNLGICVLEPPRQRVETAPLKVLEWKTMHVLGDRNLSSRETKTITPSNAPDTKLSTAASDISLLSTTAAELVKRILNDYRPRHILIERQRFRSGGAAAVQEWTLRVNMLESMLWASLATLRAEAGKSDSFPVTHAISPARVAAFWCARPAGFETKVREDLTPQTPESETTRSRNPGRAARRKVEKKEKVAFVRSWLSNEQANPNADVRLEFSDGPRIVADEFLAANGGKRSTRSKSGENSPTGRPRKLDDLADCLLQGVAWMRWMENQHKLKTMFEP